MYGYPKPASQLRTKQTMVKPKKRWISKNGMSGLIDHTSLKASSIEDRYFDSGCSRHMTGVKNFLVNIKSYSTSYVTFEELIESYKELCMRSEETCKLGEDQKKTISQL